MGEDRKPIPDPESYIDRTFCEGGYLAVAKGDSYSPRQGQIAFARAVDRAIVGKGHLIAEAGTGTGKSLSYSAPASYHAARTGNPVVIVTANNALTEQIVYKDLPLLQKAVPWEFSFALLKGRNNFACVDKYLGIEADLATNKKLFGNNIADQLGVSNPEERKQLPILYEWAKESYRGMAHGELGDKSELPFEPLHSLWSRFSVGSDECKRSKCQFKNSCFSNKANRIARQSLVVVTNYHMLFAHLRLYMDKGQDLILPPFHTVICDEAHKMPEIARDFFGFKITQGSIKRIERRLRGVAPELVGALERSKRLLFALLLGLRRDEKRYKARMKLNFLSAEVDAWQALKKALSAAHKRLVLMGDEEASYAERTLEIIESLTDAFEQQKGDRVFFLEEDNKREISICSKLIYASDILKPHLFGKIVAPPKDKDADECSDTDPAAPPEEPIPVSVICASATLATDGDNFEYMVGDMGMGPHEELIAESPFDWENQCLFIVPTTMPVPSSTDEFKIAVADHVKRVIGLARGRTLALFTSNRVLNHTYDTVRDYCKDQGITLLKQGDEPRTKLIERFKSDISSVLLGTESFWAGVDVPGEALSVVVIDRIPFPTPDDPVLDMISEKDDGWFWKYSTPRAIIAFKQGFGRLIRSMECRGVVVCLDRRIIDKRYGKQFLRALPNVDKTTNLDAIVDWLEPPPAPPAWDELPSGPAVATLPARIEPKLLPAAAPSKPEPPALPAWDEI